MSFNLNSFISNQRVLDTRDVPGVKVFDRCSIDFYNYEMYNENTFYLYETFSNGSDWYYQTATGENRKMHRYNGYQCTVNVTNSKGKNVHSKTYLTTPIENPTWEGGGVYASFSLDISSKASQEYSVMRTNHPVLYLPELDVYTIHLDYGSTKKASFQRVSGKDLDRLNPNDVLQIKDGKLTILENFYQGPKAYTIGNQTRILYNIHPQQRHFIIL